LRKAFEITCVFLIGIALTVILVMAVQPKPEPEIQTEIVEMVRTVYVQETTTNEKETAFNSRTHVMQLDDMDSAKETETEEILQDSDQETNDYVLAEDRLNPEDGINYNADGILETYYNLPMEGLIEALDRSWAYYDCINRDIIDDILENSGYWIRNDGVKMFGDYVIVAAELTQFPRGTIVETSLGTGMVLDTGEGGYDWFDLATNWQ